MALRNQFVFGLQNKKSQARLLERKDLDFEQAVKIAVTMELSEKSSEQMKSGNAGATTIDYLKTGKKPQKKQNDRKTLNIIIRNPQVRYIPIAIQNLSKSLILNVSGAEKRI